MDNEVWFSHREKKWEVTDGKFSWTDKEEIWDFDYCTVGIARTLENELIGVVRSRTDKNSSEMGNKPVELRFMLGFPIKKKALLYGQEQNCKSILAFGITLLKCFTKVLVLSPIINARGRFNLCL